jgi:CMP/dCMP kinase
MTSAERVPHLRAGTSKGVREVKMPLITITQSIGCDGLAVARRVADDLHVDIYDDSKLREEAIRMGLDAGKLDGVQEKAPTWFNRLMGDKPEVYANLIGSVIYEAARSGEGVIIGHGSQVLLQDFSCAMHVLVTATAERRISNLMGQHLTREAAEKVIHKSDSQNKGFFRFAFHKDWDDPSLYDLCVNPGKIGIERASQTIVEAARYSELKACNIYAIEALERLSQTKRIEAALLELDLLPVGGKVEIPEKGVVHISGILHNQEDKVRIPELIGGIPGVDRVDVDVMVMPAGYV